MNRREAQAYNDGRVAYREGRDFAACPRRNVAQRVAWRRGFEHERGMDLVATITPEQRQESARVIAALAAWIKTL